MRRDPKAIITAHLMDPGRKDLYVEGHSDRLFLNWIVAHERKEDARVLEITTVELPNCSLGGERGRLIVFADIVRNTNADVKIAFFADADHDRILGRLLPENVWLTDGRDMEGYLLREDCFRKVIQVGLHSEAVNPVALLSEVLKHGRTLGLLRLTSEIYDLHLPFQKTKLGRYMNVQGFSLSLDIKGYMRAVLQQGNRSLSELDSINAHVAETSSRYANISDAELVHGKDLMDIFEKILSKAGVRPDEGERLLWTSFERNCFLDYRSLSTVCEYLKT